jgi:rubrerythrin
MATAAAHHHGNFMIEEGDNTMLDEKLLECIETAINREEEAFAFYTDLAGQVTDEAARKTILFVAGEEKKHKTFLVKFRDQGEGPASMRVAEVTYYKIAEHLEEPEASESMRREEIFLLAAHRERRAHKFYTDLADLYEENSEVREMLLRIANEELKHKEKMEYLYANTSFPQTDGG